MTKVKVNVQDPAIEPAVEPAEERRGSLLEATRRMMLASIGAVAMAQEEMEAFVDRLVERGQIAEQDGKRLVRDMMERRRDQTARAEEELERRMETMLARMNVPTKSDIEILSAKITELSRKVDELKGV
jgi:poly(hydroxyalkanoate) granule-associated protein